MGKVKFNRMQNFRLYNEDTINQTEVLKMKKVDNTEMWLLFGLLIIMGLCPPIGVIIVICIALFG